MKTSIPLIAVLLLSACASTPPQTLDQKLTGKTGADRKETLRLACLNEAEWPIYNSLAYKRANSRVKSHIKMRYNEEVSTAKALCRKMDEATDTQTKKELAQEGQKLMAVTLEKHGSDAAEHTARTKQIYEKMTGVKL